MGRARREVSFVLSARVTWVDGAMFVGEAVGSGTAVVLEAGGQHRAPGPMELLLIGLGGCTAIDVVDILKKKRQKVSGLEIVVKGERAETYPRRYTAIHVEYIVKGKGIKDKAVADAIRLSEEKYCSAKASLNAKVTSSYRIVEDR